MPGRSVVEQPPYMGLGKCSQKRVLNCSATLHAVAYGRFPIARLINEGRGGENLHPRTTEKGVVMTA